MPIFRFSLNVLHAIAEMAAQFCSNCGAAITEDDDTCIGCGTPT